MCAKGEAGFTSHGIASVCTGVAVVVAIGTVRALAAMKSAWALADSAFTVMDKTDMHRHRITYCYLVYSVSRGSALPCKYAHRLRKPRYLSSIPNHRSTSWQV